MWGRPRTVSPLNIHFLFCHVILCTYVCALLVIQLNNVHCCDTGDTAYVTSDTVGPVIGDTVGPITGDTAYVTSDTVGPVIGDTVGPITGDTVGPITGDTAYVTGGTACVTGNTVGPVNSDVVVMSHCMLFIMQGAGEGERACRAVAETGSTTREEISRLYTLALLHIANQHR